MAAAGFFGKPFDPSVNILSGNSSLRPEKATTTTLGFVLSPTGWAKGMHFSLDWYRIKLIDGISGGLLQENRRKCYQGDQFYRGLIEGVRERPGPTQIVRVRIASYRLLQHHAVRAPFANVSSVSCGRPGHHV